MTRQTVWLGAALAIGFFGTFGWRAAELTAQERVMEVDGRQVQVRDQPQPSSSAQRARSPDAQRGQSRPGPGDRPAGQPQGGEAGGPDPSQAGSVSRPSAEQAADPEELRIEPDEDGKMLIHFRNQKWADVLQMLADWSGKSLDWTELPGDVVNFSTPTKYTLDEAQIVLNRMLLDRGYTMLGHAHTLSVHKLESLNPALVPRVATEDLEKRDPHDWVKVVFDLQDWLTAEEAAQDLEQMKSQHGKIQPMKATNRIEAIDAVANLQQMKRMLEDELAASFDKQRVKVFQIHYRNALDVDEMLRGLLGMKPRQSGEERPLSPQEMQMRMQMEQMRQRHQQQGQAAAPEEKGEDVQLVVNQRENTILVVAQPEKMALVEQAIQAIDIPDERATGDIGSQVLRYNSYKLSTLNPEPVVDILQEVGDLDFSTRIQADSTNRALVVYGPLADHVKIKALLDKLDSSGRKFHVWKLRRLRADYVAGTIAFMMGVDKKEDNSRSRYYGYYPYYGSSGNEQQSESSQFSVDADVENNLLLLRANDSELQEIEDLLVQLGEIRVPGSNTSTVRYLEVAPGETTQQLLERIQRMWPSVAPNPLDVQLPTPEPAQPPSDSQPPDEPESEARARPAPSPGNSTRPIVARAQEPADQQPLADSPADDSEPAPAAEPTSPTDDDQQSSESSPVEQPAIPSSPPSPAAPSPLEAQRQADQELLRRWLEQAAQSDAQAPSDGQSPSSSEAPPVTITRGPRGELILSSRDTRALDLLEDLISEQAPPATRHEIIRLRYSDAYDVSYVLEEYFAEDEEESSNTPYRYYIYDYYGQSDNSDQRRRLSERPKLKFITDYGTNSIVVKNADEQQLAIIRELVDFYDRPDPPDAQTQRDMQYYQLRYAKAEVVAERVKEVFIDLLTPNDKARQQQQQQGGDRPERVINYNFGDSGDAMRKVPKFKGQLYITADTASNSLVVLAPRYVIEWVDPMVKHLDEAARPSSSVQVLQVSGHVGPDQLQQAISRLMGQERAAQGQATAGEQPQPNQGQPQPGQGQPNGNGRRAVAR